MRDITPPTSTPTVESDGNSSDLEKRSCCEQPTQMPYSSGESSLTIAAKQESTAPSSETKGYVRVRNLYAKRIRLLMSSGLIAGITPTSIRKRSGQQTLDFAFCKPVGEGAE